MSSYADDQHDAEWCHMPLARVLREKYERTRDWRDRFREDARHYRLTPCPAGTHPALWAALAEAAAAQAEDLSAQMRQMEREGLV